MQEDLSQYAMDGEQQQAAVLAIADQDGFNWGYDPVHYMAPEGSYATDPDGLARVVEFRQMVQALHGLGLKVVLDVVYNHTFAAGRLPAAHSCAAVILIMHFAMTNVFNRFVKCSLPTFIPARHGGLLA